MRTKMIWWSKIIVIFVILTIGATLGNNVDSVGIKATPRLITIPADFKIGTATAAYQIEGGWNADGRGPSIWDTFTHNHPERIADRSNGDIAANSYELYEEDVKILDSLGVQFYRFSISWSRVLTSGDISTRNELGIQYYHKLIDALIEKKIQPMVTMYHWDLPQFLQDLGGLTNPLFVKYFEQYADLLYKEYGDKVKSWITFNEPMQYCGQGYAQGIWPPALHLAGVGDYLCAHHTLLAHAKAYHLYKEKYFAEQNGEVGITLDCAYAYPEDPNNPEHVEASERSIEFAIGLYAHPIFTEAGDYPAVVRERVDQNSIDQGYTRSRLPKFTDEEIESLKGASDFLGLNYYTSHIVRQVDGDPGSGPSRQHDTFVHGYQDPNWPKAKSSWLASFPDGLYQMLVWIRDHYDNVDVIITENGWSDDGEINDENRITYLAEHFAAIVQAIDDGCNVIGHTSWSLIDNFEWLRGYTEKFGVFRVDVDDPELKRVEKDSAKWLRDIIKNREFTIDIEE